MMASKRKTISDADPLSGVFGGEDDTTKTEPQASVQQPDNEEASGKKKNKKGSNTPAIFLVSEKHILWLDKQCNYARQDGGIALNRAKIARALLDLCMESRVDLHSLKSDSILKFKV